MYITSISPINQNIKTRKKYVQTDIKPLTVSFGASPKNVVESASHIKSLISKIVSPFVEKRKPEIVEDISSKVILGLNSKIDKVINSTKTENFEAKTQFLSDIAVNYMKAGDFDKAGVITAFNMKKVFNNPELSDIEKHNLIINEDNLYNLRKTLFLNTSTEKNYQFKPNFNSDTNIKARRYVAKIINEIGDKDFLPLAEEICKNTFIDSPEARAYITDKEDKIVLNEARLLINKHYDLAKLEPFTKLNNNCKQAVAKLIGQWGLPQHVEMLLPMLNNKDKDIVSIAFSALGEVGNASTLNILTPMLKSQDSFTSRNAALAISKLCDSQNISTLESMLKSNDPVIKKYAIRGIGKLNQPEYIPIVRSFIQDDDVGVRRDAILVIGERGSLKDIPILKNILKTDNMASEIHADDLVESIVKIGLRNEDPSILNALLNDSDYYNIVSKTLKAIIENARSKDLRSLTALNDLNKIVADSRDVDYYTKRISVKKCTNVPDLINLIKNSKDDEYGQYLAINEVFSKANFEDFNSIIALVDRNNFNSYSAQDSFIWKLFLNIGKIGKKEQSELLLSNIKDLKSKTDARNFVQSISQGRFIFKEDDFNKLKELQSVAPYKDQYNETKNAIIELMGEIGTKADHANYVIPSKSILINEQKEDMYKGSYDAFMKIFLRGNLELSS